MKINPAFLGMDIMVILGVMWIRGDNGMNLLVGEVIPPTQEREVRARWVTTTRCQANRVCTLAKCKEVLLGETDLVFISNLILFSYSPGEGKLGDESQGPHAYPPYAPCSQSPGGTWTNNVAAQHPGYMSGAGGQPSPVPGVPQTGSQTQAQAANPQAPLPSPLYPWMRSQFGNQDFK